MDYREKMELTARMESIVGHPLHTFARENKALESLLETMQSALDKELKGEEVLELLNKIRGIAIHYAKKGDLLYPQLKVKYDISGPSDLMWTTDDEIRDEMAILVNAKEHDEQWYERVRVVVKNLSEMIYKDEHVLFPICAVYFTKEEWIGIYKDSKDYPVCLGVEPSVWEEGEAETNMDVNLKGGEVVMPGGHMTVEQLTALLNTIPIEITFIDENDVNCYFNEGTKVFKRPAMAIDRPVYSCHPPKVEDQVRAILEQFKNGSLDRVPIWQEKNGRIFNVTYMAVRNRDGKYLGTVELVQDMEHAREYFEKRSR